MAVFDINKYTQMFKEEAEDLFETIDNILLEAEDAGDMDNETINSLFRSVHTLKGNSASVELSMFAALAHELEFFMDRLRNGELSFQDSMASLLIDGVDTLKHILELELNEELEHDYFTSTKEDLLYKLDNFSQDIKESLLLDEEEHCKNEKTLNLQDVEVEEEPAFGLLMPKDDEGAYGPINSNAIKNDEPSTKEDKPSTKEDEDDGFGFFDELELIEEDGEWFGFFDELSTKEDKGFGFFDDIDISDDILECDDGFGFFDTIETLPEKKVQAAQTAKEEKEVPNKELEVKESSKFKPESASSSIRVDLSKIDALMNNIGELVIAHSMLMQYTYIMQDQKIKSELSERLDLLDRYIRELQESVMSVRMIPMETVFSKFPKVIRDTAKKLNKKIDFRHYGDSVEIDKAMIEGLTDPLTHIVRNAMDHGIESTDRRRAAGKNETGTLLMSAEQANGQMIIKIQDDGGGINLAKVTAKAIQNGILEESVAVGMSNEDKAMLIFAPGLSTAEAVTDISGRGVGMDVVMSNIKKLGGAVKVETEEGFGSTFTIVLPLTLAILDGLNIRVGKEHYILPLSAIIESLKPEEGMIKQIGDEESEVLMLREEFIPVVRLHAIFNIAPQNHKLTDGILIVVRSGTKKIALFVDEFMNQQQFVIKPLDRNFRNAQGIGGATVRGDGTIGLIIDTMNIMDKN
ncbi:chemotaxis protein CheA [Sulfurimonas sp.]|uniref:chemotaxis protein CheA n=2 Tax=Sulfurimonadaceae TaxID=2771471 RepID=UPI00261924D8|nr:chemotaxis protein CheA [Sulfurimonas sp.]MDD3856404.1 chemotaxis protein CheA [Sulfurimonas sp.]